MFRVILESDVGVIAEVGQPGNEDLLCQSDESQFPLLSQIDRFSYSCFTDDMVSLLAELARLEGSDEADHIHEVYDLAERCRDAKDTVLTFTPFDE